MFGYTLHEIAIHHAKKQPGMADSLTEEAPILAVCRWKAATHDMWNVAERLDSIKGASFVSPDEPLPHMEMSTSLERVDLYMMGGILEVPSERARLMGGPDKYFADKQNVILKQAGMDTERQLVEKNWFSAAIKSKNLYDAGGTGQGLWLVAVRFDEINNVGLFNPKQFDQGRLLRITTLYNGAEHYLGGPKSGDGRMGYTIVYRGQFGWQILDAKRTCAGIANIEDASKVTPTMIDDMLANVRAQSGNTYIFCSARAKTHVLDQYKIDRVQLTNNDTQARTVIESWNGIRIITSYNVTTQWPKRITGAFRED